MSDSDKAHRKSLPAQLRCNSTDEAVGSISVLRRDPQQTEATLADDE